MRPVWDWGEQFSDKDLQLFTNPLYKRPPVELSTRQSMGVVMLPASAIRLPGLAANPANARNRMTINLLSPTASAALRSKVEVLIGYMRIVAPHELLS